MGRLFNLADGIIGQGTNSIFLITTNARVADLHPALLRPGRCMSRIEFEPHSASEAREWLPDELKGRVSGPLTLAELYELRGDHQRIEHHRNHTPRGYV
jgi:ATP-dependent 26S proteasome regulatory subunit